MPEAGPSQPAAQPPSGLGVLQKTLTDYQGTIALVTAVFGGIAALLTQVLSSLEKAKYPTIISLVIVASAAALFIRRLRVQAHVVPVNSTTFVGAQSLTAEDRKRFFGRDAEIQKITAKLTDPHIRHLVLIGESGCGKTSLLRAGVIPTLDQQATFHSVYIRLSNQPTRALRDALRGIAKAPTPTPGEPVPADAPPPSMVEELRQARERAAKPIILFLDQFEEFHINPVSPEDFQAVRELVWAVIGIGASLDVKLVFSLRYDFLHMLDAFYDETRVDQGFTGSEARIRIEAFDAAIARDVLTQMIKSSGLTWNERLLRRIIDDLASERVVYGQKRLIILPAELQLVCQMVQTQRITDSANYPGKQRLLMQPVSQAIDSVPRTDPSLVKQVLLSLIDANGLTKAQPQTVEQLARNLNVPKLPKISLVLDCLERDWNLVRRVSQRSKEVDGPPETAYELTHDYLAGIIRTVAGAELSGARKSQAILHTARLQAEHNPRVRLPIGDCWQIRKHPPQELAPEDRALLRRSVQGFFVARLVPLAVLLLGITAVRQGSVYIDVDREAVIVYRQGAPFLHPLLGSRKAIVHIIANNSLPSWTGELEKWSRSQPWRLGLPGGVLSGMDVDALLQKHAREAALLHAASEPRGRYEFVQFGVAFPEIRGPLVSTWEKQLWKTIEQIQRDCGTSDRQDAKCKSLLGAGTDLAFSISRLRPKSPELIAALKPALREAPFGSWQFRASDDLIRDLGGTTDPEILPIALNRLRQAKEGRDVLPVIRRLWRASTVPGQESSVSPDMRARAVEFLLAEKTEQQSPAEFSHRLDVLTAWAPDQQQVRAWLLDQLSRADAATRTASIKYRLRLHDPQVQPEIVESLQRATDALKAGKDTAYPDVEAAAKLLDRLDRLADEMKELEILEPVRAFLSSYMAARWLPWSEPAETGMLSFATRLGVRTTDILKLRADPSPRSIYELQNTLERVVSAALLKDNAVFFDSLRLPEPIQAIVQLHLEDDNERNCSWISSAIAFHIPVSATLLEQKLSGVCGGSGSGDLARIYARYVLLTPQENTATLEPRLEQLLKLALGPQGDRSIGHRKAAVHAIRLLRPPKPTDAKEAKSAREDVVKRFDAQLEALLQNPHTPFHHRMAIADILGSVPDK